MESDEVLRQKFVEKGDQAAFEEIVRRYLGFIRRQMAVQLWSDRDLAQDAEQEVLWKLFNILKNFQSESSLAAFISGICRHTVWQLLRSRGRRWQREQSWFVESEVLQTTKEAEADPLHSLVGQAHKQEIWDILGQIPEPDRSLLYLKEGEGLEVKELAKIFGVPEGTVKSKLARARKKFRDFWEVANESFK